MNSSERKEEDSKGIAISSKEDCESVTDGSVREVEESWICGCINVTGTSGPCKEMSIRLTVPEI